MILFVITSIFGTFNFIATSIIGFSYPAYMTVLTIENEKNTKEDEK